ncbi:hypothetical protein evm_001738 [Chilo suppressalis]|nr:hypothetical protein evm_001738 [Chilo suppressalis]
MEYRGKPKSTHDLLDDPKLSRKTAAELEEEVNNGKEETDKEAEEKREKTAVAVSNIRDKLSAKKRERSPEADSNKKKKTDDVESDSDSPVEEYYLGKERDEARLKERDRIRNEIKQLKREMKAPKEESKKETEASPEKKIEQDNEMYQQFIEEQEKYKQMKDKIPKKGAARESFTLNLLAKFKNKLHAIKEKVQTEGEKEADNDEAINTDEWLGHTLRFEEKGAVLAKDASTKSDDWFDIYDPRNPINKRKREKGDKNNKK